MRLNWPAVLVAALADWILGAVWFTAFAKPWMAGLRMSQQELHGYMAHPNFWPYVVAFLCSLVLAYVIAWLLARGIQGLLLGIGIGLLVGMAAAAAMVTEMAFEMMSGTFMAIAAGYPLVGCIIMGIILGAWRRRADEKSERKVAVTT